MKTQKLTTQRLLSYRCTGLQPKLHGRARALQQAGLRHHLGCAHGPVLIQALVNAAVTPLAKKLPANPRHADEQAEFLRPTTTRLPVERAPTVYAASRDLASRDLTRLRKVQKGLHYLTPSTFKTHTVLATWSENGLAGGERGSPDTVAP